MMRMVCFLTLFFSCVVFFSGNVTAGKDEVPLERGVIPTLCTPGAKSKLSALGGVPFSEEVRFLKSGQFEDCLKNYKKFSGKKSMPKKDFCSYLKTCVYDLEHEKSIVKVLRFPPSYKVEGLRGQRGLFAERDIHRGEIIGCTRGGLLTLLTPELQNMMKFIAEKDINNPDDARRYIAHIPLGREDNLEDFIPYFEFEALKDYSLHVLLPYHLKQEYKVTGCADGMFSYVPLLSMVANRVSPMHCINSPVLHKRGDHCDDFCKGAANVEMAEISYKEGVAHLFFATKDIKKGVEILRCYGSEWADKDLDAGVVAGSAESLPHLVRMSVTLDVLLYEAKKKFGCRQNETLRKFFSRDEFEGIGLRDFDYERYVSYIRSSFLTLLVYDDTRPFFQEIKESVDKELDDGKGLNTQAFAQLFSRS